MLCLKVCLHREATAKVMATLNTAKVKAVHAHHKVMQTVHSRRIHRHVFHYALATHFIDVAVSASNIDSFDRVVAFAAGLGTLLLHLTESTESEEKPREKFAPDSQLDRYAFMGA